MNSLVSYNWLKEYVDLKGVTPDEFAKRVSLSGPGIEKIYPQGADLDKVVVGHVLEVNPHPNADKLRIALVDIGEKTPATIVCGGSNLEVNQWVAVALIGARVKWHGEGELITLAPAEIRGVKSDGMICGASEIGLADAFPHGEREILDLSLVGAHGMRPGLSLSDFLDLSSDSVMDIEVTSNRVDAMGMVGMAREASAILDKKMIWKPVHLPQPLLRKEGSHADRSLTLTKGEIKRGLSVSVTAKKQCPRYMAIKMDGVSVEPSPWWMKRRLLSAGLRPINNLVDISNYVMLELAQPTHMFDAAKLEGGINVRFAHDGEMIKALDGKEYKLEDSILVIADKKKPVAIAGVMGGEETGVSASTTSVIIECANFEPVCIRRGARKINLQSDAQLRFEKGLSTQALPEALARVVELVKELAGGHIASNATDVAAGKYSPVKYSIGVEEVNALIGVPVARTEMVGILKRLGFIVTATAKKISVVVPWWRDHDIEDGRDLVEEIARVKGYANIPGIVPCDVASRPMEPELYWEKQVRDISKGAGMTELYTYSFIPKELVTKAGYDPKGMLHVQNPLSTDFEVMRTTLLPGLLQIVSENRERFPEQRLFEVSNVYYPNAADWSDLPDEQLEIGALFMGMKNPWRHAKGYVEHLLSEMGISGVEWKRLSDDAFWHPGRSAQAFRGEELIATIGEVSPKIAAQFKLDGPVGLVDIPFEKIIPDASHARQFISIPAFPEAKRDLAVMVDQETEYEELAKVIRTVDSLITNVEWFDTYVGKNLPENKKSVAMHFTFSASDRTLESGVVDGLMEKIQSTLKQKFGAEIR